jgi:hypothetical protein
VKEMGIDNKNCHLREVATLNKTAVQRANSVAFTVQFLDGL